MTNYNSEAVMDDLDVPAAAPAKAREAVGARAAAKSRGLNVAIGISAIVAAIGIALWVVQMSGGMVQTAMIYIGGRWGKKVAHGIPLTKIFTSEEEVIDVVERAILLFRDEGISGERFADTVNRLGFDYVNEKLLSGAIDKAAVLQKKVKGGATC